MIIRFSFKLNFSVHFSNLFFVALSASYLLSKKTTFSLSSLSLNPSLSVALFLFHLCILSFLYLHLFVLVIFRILSVFKFLKNFFYFQEGGGYFVINGNEKVIRLLINQRKNFVSLLFKLIVYFLFDLHSHMKFNFPIKGSAQGMMIIVGNELCHLSSNHEGGCLHFTKC